MVIKDQFIFIHVPRAGGVAITAALGGRLEGVPLHNPRSHLQTKRFSFGFVRNPWERMVSLYRFQTMKRRTTAANFEEWLTEGEDWLDEDVGFRRPLEPLQRRPAWWWLEGCDVIGRFERIEEDLTDIIRSRGCIHKPLMRQNGTTGGDWRLEYNVRMIDFVAEHHATDIDRFGYAFNGVKQ